MVLKVLPWHVQAVKNSGPFSLRAIYERVTSLVQRKNNSNHNLSRSCLHFVRVMPLFLSSQTYCLLCCGSLMSSVPESSPLESPVLGWYKGFSAVQGLLAALSLLTSSCASGCLNYLLCNLLIALLHCRSSPK